MVKDHASGGRILEIEVRGKRGVGYSKSMPAAVDDYRRLFTDETSESLRARKEAESGDIKPEPKIPQTRRSSIPPCPFRLLRRGRRREAAS